MVITQDIRKKTGKPGAVPTKQQTEFLRLMAEAGLFNAVVWGSSSTGKTIIIIEGGKMMNSKLRKMGKNVKMYLKTRTGALWTTPATSTGRSLSSPAIAVVTRNSST